MTRTRLTSLFVATVLLALTGCSSVSSESTTASMTSDERGGSNGRTPDAGSIDWTSCELELAALAGLQCGTIEVPVDHTRSDGPTLDLAVARVAATGDAAERIGSLVMNPGGPGGSGIEFLAGASMLFPESLSERFDLVSFDPRGVGASTPVRCLSDEEKEAELEGDLSPDTPEEVQEAIEEQAEFLESCQTRSGDLIRHMSTADVAEDLDLLRIAVGDEQLTYLGYSYGTSIGATYATLFPDRARALVLDGSISPVATPEETALAQAQGFERTLASFVEACNPNPECALAPDAAAAIDTARRSLESAPVEVDDGTDVRVFTPDLFDFALATALYDTSVWGATADAIADLSGGGAATLFRLVDRQTGRQPDGTYDNSSDARAMVNCADERDRLDPAEAAESARRIVEAAPRFGPLIGWGTLGCLEWPEPVNPLPEPTGDGAPPILVVGTLGDPATPYEWSEQMADALTSAILVTYEGDGHTAFLRGSSCIEDVVVAYLIDLDVPEPGTSCPAESKEVAFTSLSDTIIGQFVEAGLPEPLARCVVDGIRDEIGDERFNELALSNQIEEFTRLVTAQALRCSAAGGD